MIEGLSRTPLDRSIMRHKVVSIDMGFVSALAEKVVVRRFRAL